MPAAGRVRRARVLVPLGTTTVGLACRTSEWRNRQTR